MYVCPIYGRLILYNFMHAFGKEKLVLFVTTRNEKDLLKRVMLSHACFHADTPLKGRNFLHAPTFSWSHSPARLQNVVHGILCGDGVWWQT